MSPILFTGSAQPSISSRQDQNVEQQHSGSSAFCHSIYQSSTSTSVYSKAGGNVKYKFEKQKKTDILDRLVTRFGLPLLPLNVQRTLKGSSKKIEEARMRVLLLDRDVEQMRPHIYGSSYKKNLTKKTQQLQKEKRKLAVLVEQAENQAAVNVGELRRFWKEIAKLKQCDMDHSLAGCSPAHTAVHRASISLSQIKSLQSNFKLKNVKFDLSDIKQIDEGHLEIDISNFSIDMVPPSKKNMEGLQVENMCLIIKGPLMREILSLLSESPDSNFSQLRRFLASGIIDSFKKIAAGNLSSVESIEVKSVECIKISKPVRGENLPDMLEMFRSSPLLAALFSLSKPLLNCQKLVIDFFKDGVESKHVQSRVEIKKFEVQAGPTIANSPNFNATFSCSNIDFLVHSDWIKQYLFYLDEADDMGLFSKLLPVIQNENEGNLYCINLQKVQGKLLYQVQRKEMALKKQEHVSCFETSAFHIEVQAESLEVGRRSSDDDKAQKQDARLCVVSSPILSRLITDEATQTNMSADQLCFEAIIPEELSKMALSSVGKPEKIQVTINNPSIVNVTGKNVKNQNTEFDDKGISVELSYQDKKEPLRLEIDGDNQRFSGSKVAQIMSVCAGNLQIPEMIFDDTKLAKVAAHFDEHHCGSVQMQSIYTSLGASKSSKENEVGIPVTLEGVNVNFNKGCLDLNGFKVKRLSSAATTVNKLVSELNFQQTGVIKAKDIVILPSMVEKKGVSAWLLKNTAITLANPVLNVDKGQLNLNSLALAGIDIQSLGGCGLFKRFALWLMRHIVNSILKSTRADSLLDIKRTDWGLNVSIPKLHGVHHFFACLFLTGKHFRLFNHEIKILKNENKRLQFQIVPSAGMSDKTLDFTRKLTPDAKIDLVKMTKKYRLTALLAKKEKVLMLSKSERETCQALVQNWHGLLKTENLEQFEEATLALLQHIGQMLSKEETLSLGVYLIQTFPWYILNYECAFGTMLMQGRRMMVSSALQRLVGTCEALKLTKSVDKLEAVDLHNEESCNKACRLAAEYGYVPALNLLKHSATSGWIAAIMKGHSPKIQRTLFWSKVLPELSLAKNISDAQYEVLACHYKELGDSPGFSRGTVHDMARKKLWNSLCSQLFKTKPAMKEQRETLMNWFADHLDLIDEKQTTNNTLWKANRDKKLEKVVVENAQKIIANEGMLPEGYAILAGKIDPFDLLWFMAMEAMWVNGNSRTQRDYACQVLMLLSSIVKNQYADHSDGSVHQLRIKSCAWFKLLNPMLKLLRSKSIEVDKDTQEEGAPSVTSTASKIA